MERAEFATGSVNVRGSSAIHRILSFLGAVLFGIGPAARAKESDKWWEREDYDSPHDTGIQMTLGQQAELFDIAGEAVFKPLETPPPPVSAPVPPVAAPAAPRTIVSVQSKSRTTARVVATTRAAPVVRVSAVTKTAQAARGSVARHLMMSQSISSGKEAARWFSVPQRALLPRYQLFEGSPGVTEGADGLRISARELRTQRGRVWFV
ncbi:MAG TPA: hypothetical protein GX689_01320 [Lentisphaerae bacterium]|nr:hypothetical protein [Lentisphaerota bacterium]